MARQKKAKLATAGMVARTLDVLARHAGQSSAELTAAIRRQLKIPTAVAEDALSQARLQLRSEQREALADIAATWPIEWRKALTEARRVGDTAGVAQLLAIAAPLALSEADGQEP